MSDPSSPGLRLVVVDDQALVRAGFRMILERAGFDVVAEAADGVEAVQAATDHLPDLVLMDIRMPRLDGIEATRRILARRLQTKILVLTTFDLDEYVYDAIQAGASGFLLKDVLPADLVQAVHVVHRGDVLLAPAVTRRLLQRFVTAPRGDRGAERLTPLTERERGVMVLVASGLSNAEIGAQLFLTEATVKTYVSRLLAKLNVRDRVQLTVLAYQTGLAP